MKLKKHIIISDMPNIYLVSDCAGEGSLYFGYRGIYKSKHCPVCRGLFYYNPTYYPEATSPPTCGRYNCLKGVFCRV